MDTPYNPARVADHLCHWVLVWTDDDDTEQREHLQSARVPVAGEQITHFLDADRMAFIVEFVQWDLGENSRAVYEEWGTYPRPRPLVCCRRVAP